MAADPASLRLRETLGFHWRRNLPLLEAKKTIFNFVATWNNLERRFAEFLDRASDVERFAALATTEQGGAGVQFRVDYLKRNGAIGFYYPDWVVVQRRGGEETNWIIETKGREFEDTVAKDQAAQDGCRRAQAATGRTWRYHRVNQKVFRP